MLTFAGVLRLLCFTSVNRTSHFITVQTWRVCVLTDASTYPACGCLFVSTHKCISKFAQYFIHPQALLYAGEIVAKPETTMPIT